MEQKIKYQLKKSARARRMRLAVFCDGSVVVTTPPRFSESLVEKWIREKTDWILGKIAHFEKKGFRVIPKRSRGEYMRHKSQAKLLAKRRLAYFSEIYGIPFGKISIRNQKTRWGSCSRNGNLSFNYKIALVEPHLADYVIVHELCHIKQFNHSRNFWALVAQSIPDYKNIRRQIKAL